MAPPEDGPEPERDPEDPVSTLLRVGKTFLVPFLASWAIAFVGSKLELDWLHFIGLGGVGLSTIALLLWLVR